MELLCEIVAGCRVMHLAVCQARAPLLVLVLVVLVLVLVCC